MSDLDTSDEGVARLDAEIAALAHDHYDDEAGVSTRVGLHRRIRATLRAQQAEVERLRARVVELLEANNREVERRRAAERAARLDLARQLAGDAHRVVQVKMTDRMKDRMQSWAVCAGYLQEGWEAALAAAQEDER